MVDIAAQSPVSVSTGATEPNPSLRRLGAVIAEMLSVDPGLASPACRLEMELQVTPGSELQIDLQDDVLTVRGAVLTIRGVGHSAVPEPEPEKYYY